MASSFMNDGKVALWDGTVDLDTDTIKVMLLTSSWTPNIDADQFIDDISANEVSSSGYTAGGATLASADVTVDDVNDRAKFDATDVTWSTVTFTTRYGAIYKDTGTPATSPIVAYFDWGGDQSPSAADFTITWHADGIFYY